MTIQSFLDDEASRREYWRYKGETWKVICAAEPNPGHLALSHLADAGRIDLLVTQNVDGLHERSGFPRERLINIHGTDSAVVCMECERRSDRKLAQGLWESGEQVPQCECGGPWKPATISFGQSLVQSDLNRSLAAAAACDLFVAAGTSLVVGPINDMFSLAQRADAFTAIITGSETPFDEQASCKVEDPLQEILPALANKVLG